MDFYGTRMVRYGTGTRTLHVHRVQLSSVVESTRTTAACDSGDSTARTVPKTHNTIINPLFSITFLLNGAKSTRTGGPNNCMVLYCTRFKVQGFKVQGSRLQSYWCSTGQFAGIYIFIYIYDIIIYSWEINTCKTFSFSIPIY